MHRSLVYLICLVVSGIIGFIKYFADEKREERGEPTKHREYMGSLSDNNMTYIEHMRSELEDIKYAREATENQQREKYVFHDSGDGMDDIYSCSPNNDKME